MKDHPAYKNGRGHGGPRTKRQLRKRQMRAQIVKIEQEKQLKRDNALASERRSATLHSINWQP